MAGRPLGPSWGQVRLTTSGKVACGGRGRPAGAGSMNCCDLGAAEGFDEAIHDSGHAGALLNHGLDRAQALATHWRSAIWRKAS